MKALAVAALLVSFQLVQTSLPGSPIAPPASALASTQELRLARGWYIQLSAETSEDAANEKAKKLEGFGQRTAIQQTAVRGVTYFRVLAGPYASKEDAEGEFLEVQVTGLADGKPFIRYQP